MPRIEVLPAEATHVGTIARRMRDADRAEVWASACVGPEEALRRSLAASPLAWTGLVDGRPACMFGAGTGRCGQGLPWLLGTGLIEANARAFLRRNRAYVEAMQAAFPLLANHVDARNASSIRWLRWLGFTIGQARPWGPFALPFHPFWRRRHV